MLCTLPPKLSTALIALVLLLVAESAFAHGGRRFRVDFNPQTGKLVAQGTNTIDRLSDPAGDRPYSNAIHDHWLNSSTGSAASATLPGYDIGNAADVLTGQDLHWTLTGASQWTVSQVPLTRAQAQAEAINLQPLDAGTTLFAQFIDGVSAPQLASTTSPSSLRLIDGFDGSNGFDLDILYEINQQPTNTLYVLESILSTDPLGSITADTLVSDTVYTIFSIQGDAASGGTPPEYKLHWAALKLENALGSPIPEPAALLTLTAGLPLLLKRRR